MDPNAVDIDVIESSKENIQSLASGRSARALAQVYSGSSQLKSEGGFRSFGTLKAVPSPSQNEVKNEECRAEFEQELTDTFDDSDDPLDIYDRYVKWTLSAYPSGQATAASGLLTLLERATQPFVSSPQYANDPRYLKLWMLYIRFFSDDVKETYRFLALNRIGSSLALFYEEYAGWLETEGRWLQAEETYLLGINEGARPPERLRRKYAEFQRRFEQRPTDGPGSPAIPTDRPALASKNDPPAGEYDPQAESRSRPVAAVAKPKKSKMAIFSDLDVADQESQPAATTGLPKWDSISSVQNRRKENTQQATSWAGATLKGGKKAPGPKLEIFRDETFFQLLSSQRAKQNSGDHTRMPPRQDDGQNPQSGKRERVYVNLNTLFSNSGRDESSFEEVWAQRAGWLSVNWRQVRMEQARERASQAIKKVEASRLKSFPRPPQQGPDPVLNTGFPPRGLSGRLVSQPVHNEDGGNGGSSQSRIHQPPTATPRTGRALAPKSLQPFRDEGGENDDDRMRREPEGKPKLSRRSHGNGENDENNENALYNQGRPESESRIRTARRAQRRDEKANRTTQIEVRDAPETTTTTTIPANLGSPVAPRVRRRKGGGRSSNNAQEPTMTLNTKEAMNEIYDIFSAPLKGEQTGPVEEDEDIYGDGSDSDVSDCSDDGSESGSASGESENEDEFTSGAESTYTTKTGAASGSGSEDDSDGNPQHQRRSSEASEYANFLASNPPPLTDTVITDQDMTAEAIHARLMAEEDCGNREDDPDWMGDIHATPGRPNGYDETGRDYEDDYYEEQEAPVNPYRAGGYARRLPFMTPIVERTESSIRLATTGRTIRTGDRRGWTETKTPSRMGMPGVPEAGEFSELAVLPEMPDLDGIDLDEEVGGPESDSDVEMGSPGPRRDVGGHMGRSPRLAVYRDENPPKGTDVSADEEMREVGDSAGPLGLLDLDRLRDTLPLPGHASTSTSPLKQSFLAPLGESSEQLLDRLPYPTAIITDNLCNPLDSAIRQTIVEATQPPLSKWLGFCDRRSNITRKGYPEIAKGLKASGGTGHKIWLGANQDEEYIIRQELGRGTFAPVYLAESSGWRPGCGGDLIKARESHLEAVKLESPASVWEFYILRLARTRLLSLSSQLTNTRAVHSIVPAFELHLFADESYLIEQYRPEGTLLDIINAARMDVGTGGGPGGTTAVGDEMIALFFAAEVIRTVEGLHAVGILHGDLKVDNVLVRFGNHWGSNGNGSSSFFLTGQGMGGGGAKNASPASVSSPLFPPTSSPFSSPAPTASSTSSPFQTRLTMMNPCPGGTLGSLSSLTCEYPQGHWSEIGIQLIDFGRGIDLHAFQPSTQFIADWNTTETDCVEVREMRPWRWQIDYYGLAGIVHTLLYGRYLDIVTVSGGGGGKKGGAGYGSGAFELGAGPPSGIGIGDKVYRVRDSLKRYWQTDIWNDLFFILLNPGRYVQIQQQQASASTPANNQDPINENDAAIQASLILADGLRRCRERIEQHLVQNCRRGEGGLIGMLRKLETRMKSRRR